jgi:hypothetical protein
MTPAQIKLARHALGLPNDHRRSYRNRYFAPIGGIAYVEWCDMVADGLARGKEEAGSSLALFYLTVAGAARVLNADETLDIDDFDSEAAL